MQGTNATTVCAGNTSPRGRGPHAPLHPEPVGAQLTTPDSDARRRPRLGPRWRLGGSEGNEILTSASAVVLVLLLVAEGITIVHMHGLLSARITVHDHPGPPLSRESLSRPAGLWRGPDVFSDVHNVCRQVI
jgi:hypothetical protein